MMDDEYIRREDAIKIAERYGLANGSVLGRHIPEPPEGE